MYILSLDSTATAATVALCDDERMLACMTIHNGNTHSQTLLPLIENTLGQFCLRPSDMGLIACSAGPGSFTGVRIGVCAVKGLAHAYNIPCIQIDALEALSMNFQHFDGVACPILDARRNQVYCAAFDMKNGMPERILEDDAIEIGAFLEKLPKDRKLVFLGDGLRVHEQKIRETLGDRAVIAPANLRQLRAEAACLLAEQRKEQWMEGRLLTPIYLRIPQAERERNARLNEAK